jgi:hypothetical protein
VAEDELTGYLHQSQLAAGFRTLLDTAVAALAVGDGARFAQLLSPNLLHAAGSARIDTVLQEQLLPFFRESADLSNQMTITHATDMYGNDGLAFYTAIRTRAGQARPFVGYIVEEAGRAVVANLLVNTTYEEMHGGRSPGTDG